MAELTMISWCDSTFNPVIGCTEVSPGCDNCYAREFAKAKFPVAKWGAGQPRYRTSTSNWELPCRWNRKAEKSGKPWRVFCGSLCDVFDNEWSDDVRRDLWALIANTPALTWLLLTKRIGNAATMAPGGFQPYVWVGATITTQGEFDRDSGKLRRVRAGLRFLSMEPLLGNVKMDLDGIGWVIVGAESGPHRRPFDHAWLRSIVEQCKAANVPVFVKQGASFRPGIQAGIPDDLWQLKEFPVPTPWSTRQDSR